MLLPRSERRRLELLDDEDAGVQDEHLDGPELALDLREAAVDRSLVGDVHRHRRAAVEGHGLQVGCHDTGALRGERLRDRAPDSPPGAGDERDPPVEPADADAGQYISCPPLTFIVAPVT